MIPTIRVLAVAIALASPTYVYAAFETPPTLDATEVAPPELLSGAHYKVAPKATVEGYMARFEVESDFGSFPALGTELLRIRVSEIPAIASLSEVSQSTAFKDALAKSAAVPVDFAKSVATDPKRTAANVASGVGQLFGSAGRAIRQGAEYAGDKAADAKSGKSSAGGASQPTFTDDPLGYNKAKREWAKKLESTRCARKRPGAGWTPTSGSTTSSAWPLKRSGGTVTYVGNIYKYYVAYRLVQDEVQEREKAKEEIGKGGGK